MKTFAKLNNEINAICELFNNDKIFEINQLIWKLKEERTEARKERDFDTTTYLSAQIYGMEQAINILNKD